MPKNLLLLVLMTVLSATACLENSDTETRLRTETTLMVDLETVVRVGNVVPVEGVTTAGQPDAAALTVFGQPDAAALTVFAEQGYKTVIDIRTEPEDRGMDEATVIGDLGMEYIVFPIDKPEAINFDNARELSRLIAESEGPVLVHCGSSNRVGALFAEGRVKKVLSNN